VSVDYLIHLAFAYKHSLMPEQYYKTRAVLLARSGSTLASGLTTLCAVLPLLGANILPLRTFGVIFTVVALVSLGCALLLFNALLMCTGPGIALTIHSLPKRASSLPPLVSTAGSVACDGALPALLVPFGGGASSGTRTSQTATPGTSYRGGGGMGARGIPGAIVV
jgi:hypothetical protein